MSEPEGERYLDCPCCSAETEGVVYCEEHGVPWERCAADPGEECRAAWVFLDGERAACGCGWISVDGEEAWINAYECEVVHDG